MMIGIVSEQAFGLSNGDQVAVGTNKRQRWSPCLNQFPVRKPGCCQLHSIISPQWMPVRQLPGNFHDHWIHIHHTARLGLQ
jgi:hypothetical protein